MAAITAGLNPALARAPYRVGRLVDRVIALAIPASVELLMSAAEDAAEHRLAVDVGERARFEQRLQRRWGAALDTLMLFRLSCLDAGVAFHDRHKPAEGDWVYAVLVRLQARACLVAAEVLALLRAGFASGAHARWRVAHEIAVVGSFVKEHGQDTAERYLRHDAVEKRPCGGGLPAVCEEARLRTFQRRGTCRDPDGPRRASRQVRHGLRQPIRLGGHRAPTP